MNSPSKFKTGITFGIVAGIVYMLVLTARYVFFGNTPLQLGIMSALGYVLLVVFFILSANVRKKQLGGYASVKDLFGTIFIVLLIAELCFSVYNYVYLRYIDPGYLSRFSQSAQEWMRQTKMSEDKLLEFQKAMEEQQQTTFGTLALGFAQSVIMDSIVGIIIAFILKRNKPAMA